MKQRFQRNLPPTFVLDHDVTLKFYLTAEGVIRDVNVLKPSLNNSNAELACIDAVYSASPLPAPPKVRAPLPPPPMGMLLPPDFFGTGMYTYTFSAYPPGPRTQDKAPIPRYYGHLVIPREILFRYPNRFTSAELEADSNKMRGAQLPTSELLDKARFQWVLFYQLKPNATRTEIRQHAKLITLVYFNLMEPRLIGNFFQPVDNSSNERLAIESWLSANSRKLNEDERKSIGPSNVSLLITFASEGQPAVVWLKPEEPSNNAAYQILWHSAPLRESPNDLVYERGLVVTFSGERMTFALAPSE